MIIAILRGHKADLWRSIRKKAKEGKREWHAQGHPNDKIWCPCWTTKLTRAEDLLLDRMHKLFYGKDWYIVDPLGWDQVNYILYDDLRYKVWTL